MIDAIAELFRKTLFGIGFGRLPADMREELEAEGLRLCDEGVHMVLRFWKYRSKGIYFGNKRHGWIGYVAATDTRLVCSGYSHDRFDLSLDPSKVDLLEVEAVGPRYLRIRFQAEDFHPERRGKVECRYETAGAKRFAEHVRERMRGGDA